MRKSFFALTLAAGFMVPAIIARGARAEAALTELAELSDPFLCPICGGGLDHFLPVFVTMLQTNMLALLSRI